MARSLGATMLLLASMASCTCLAPVVECQPLSCADQGKNCGALSDGCDHLIDCGNCADPSFCGGGGANLCGERPCEPSTCAALGAECGRVADGCGATLECGTCQAPLLCGAPGQVNRCVPFNTTCDPKTCSELATECGSADDGCGNTLDCGSCPATQTCTDARCACTTDDCNNVWSTLGNDIGHTGFSRFERGVPPLTLRWSAFDVGNGQVVTDGLRAYARTYFGVTTFDAADGRQLWSRTFNGQIGQPAIYGRQVYTTNCNHESDTKLWSLDAATGAVTFSVAMNAQWDRYWAPIKVGGGVYTNGGSYGGLYGFDAVTGANLFFNSTLGQYDEWSPASDGTLLYVFIEGRFDALDARTGVSQWQVTVPWTWTGWSMEASPVVANGLAYVISPPVLHAIDLSTHAIRWSASLNFKGTAAVANGVVYAINAGNVRALDAQTGVYRWTFVGDGALSFTPALTRTHLYAASAANVYAVDLGSRAPVWTEAGGGSLSVAAGTLYVAGADGELKAYSLTPP